jgi:regulation of enolase protein 1 (concanavalin A-like superfamily)
MSGMDPDPRTWQDVDGAPSELWQGDPADGALTAPARTDWFVDPATGAVTASAPLLLTPTSGDVQLRAQVRADLRSTFDAVALFVHADRTRWAKLALERSPEGVDTVVTVVTREVSDDANGPAVPEPGRAWLRVSRVGEVYAFHHSADGTRWSLARLFTLGAADGHRVGLSVQSPMGDGLTARVSDVALTATTLADPRDGT